MNSLALRQALVLVACAFLPGIVQALYYRDKASWEAPVPASEMVSVEKAQEWGDKVLWVDARPDEDFAHDHIPGAVPLNEDRWNELLPKFLEAWAPEKKVVVYCSTESCALSRDVARRLRNEAQLKNIFVLDGGWEAWLQGPE